MWILFGAETPSYNTIELNQFQARFHGEVFEKGDFWKVPLRRALDAFSAKKSCVFLDYHGSIISLFLESHGREYMLEAYRRAFPDVAENFSERMNCDAKTFFETARSHIFKDTSKPKPVLGYMQELILMLKGLNMPIALLSSTSIEFISANYDTLVSIPLQFSYANISECINSMNCSDLPPLTDTRIKRTPYGLFLEKGLSKADAFRIIMAEWGYTSAVILEDSQSNIENIRNVNQGLNILFIHNTESVRQKNLILAERELDAFEDVYRQHLVSCAYLKDSVTLKHIKSIQEKIAQIKIEEKNTKFWNRSRIVSFIMGGLGVEILHNISPKLIATVFVEMFGLNTVSRMLYGLFDGISSFLMNTIQTFFSPPTKASAPERFFIEPLENVCLANHSLWRTEPLHHIKPEIRFFRIPSMRFMCRSSMRDLFIFDKPDLSLKNVCLANHTLKSPQDETRMLMPSRMMPSMFSGIMHPYLDIDLLDDSLDEFINFRFNMDSMRDILCCCKSFSLSYKSMGFSLGSMHWHDKLVDNNLNICWANHSLQDAEYEISPLFPRLEFGGNFYVDGGGYNDIIMDYGGCDHLYSSNDEDLMLNPMHDSYSIFDEYGNVLSSYGIGALRIPNTEAFYKDSVENSLAAYKKPSIYDSLYENLSLKDALGFGLLAVGYAGFVGSKMFESYHINKLNKLRQKQADLEKALRDRENFLSSSF